MIGLGVLDIFKTAAGIPAVTFHEYLMYRYLVELWVAARRDLPAAHRAKLHVGYTKSGHLKVAWNGAAEEAPRLVLIAHVDREGFIVSKVFKKKKECEGWYGSYQFNSESLLGRQVEICIRDGTYHGVITDEEGNGRCVKVRLDGKKQDGCQVIETDHFVGLGYYRLDPWEMEEEQGFISSPCVDNCGGVSVATNAVGRAAYANKPVNMEVIYTTCEEAGLSGIVKLILEAPEEFADDSVWVVVDCSNRSRCIPESLPSALVSRCPALVTENEREVDLRTTVIRTGDSRSTFSRGVSHLLYRASVNAVRRVGLHGAEGEVSRAGQAMDSQETLAEYAWRPRLREWVRQGGVWGGRMAGGACEATPLVVAREILEKYGRHGGHKDVRVGSVAIPISNFGNTFKGEVTRERCHVAALMLASELLIEAAETVQRYPWYITEAVNSRSLADDVAGTVENLSRWFKENEALLSVTGDWARGHY